MDRLIYEMIESGGWPTLILCLSGLAKWFLTIVFLISGINFFQNKS